MIFIAHRGNTDGPNPKWENCPIYLKQAIKKGFDVEVDVWYESEGFWLGHDYPQYIVDWRFLTNPRCWCHAKNLDALVEMLKIPTIHCFWHQNDNLALTSRNYIWTYPGKPLAQQSVAVMPEWNNFTEPLNGCVAICSDFVNSIRSQHEQNT